MGDKVVRLGPAVDTDRFAAAPPRPADGPLRLLYAGTLGMAQNVATLVEAARRLGPDVVEVTIAGDGADGPALREDVAANPAPNVRMLGIVPAERVPSLLAEHDAAVVLLRDHPIFAGALPTKLFEAMARSRPVILGARGEAAAMVERYGAGVVVPPEDVEALARAMAELAADRGRLESLAEGALRCAEDHSWTRVGAAWAELSRPSPATARDQAATLASATVPSLDLDRGVRSVVPAVAKLRAAPDVAVELGVALTERVQHVGQAQLVAVAAVADFSPPGRFQAGNRGGVPAQDRGGRLQPGLRRHPGSRVAHDLRHDRRGGILALLDHRDRLVEEAATLGVSVKDEVRGSEVPVRERLSRGERLDVPIYPQRQLRAGQRRRGIDLEVPGGASRQWLILVDRRPAPRWA